MKTVKDFSKEINKCSKCGLCQAVCPVYKVTGNDCAVSRGKFVMLDGVVKGDLKLNKNINKYLDMCLKCGKCKEFCPSSIDVSKIFETAKYEYMKNSFAGRLIFFLQSKLIFGNIISFFKLFTKCRPNKNDNALKVTYFKGCVNDVFKNDFVKKIPDVYIEEKDFECCGLPFLSSGNLERFEKVKENNLKLLEGSKYVLTDCASCESTLSQYFEDKSSPVFINLGELVVKQNMKFKFKKPLKVTFHKPCHLKNDDFIKPLLANCENIEYIEAENYDDCCGFAGEFALKNPALSREIIRKKAESIIKTNADIVITTCPSCVMGLSLGLSGSKVKVMGLAQFLNSAAKISS